MEIRTNHHMYKQSFIRYMEKGMGYSAPFTVEERANAIQTLLRNLKKTDAQLSPLYILLDGHREQIVDIRLYIIRLRRYLQQMARESL